MSGWRASERIGGGGKECLPELIKTVDKGFTIHTYLTAVRFAKSYVCQHLINHQTPVKFRAHEGPTFYGCAKVPRTFCLYAVMYAISHIIISTRSNSQHQHQALRLVAL